MHRSAAFLLAALTTLEGLASAWAQPAERPVALRSVIERRVQEPRRSADPHLVRFREQLARALQAGDASTLRRVDLDGTALQRRFARANLEGREIGTLRGRALLQARVDPAGGADLPLVDVRSFVGLQATGHVVAVLLPLVLRASDETSEADRLQRLAEGDRQLALLQRGDPVFELLGRLRATPRPIERARRTRHQEAILATVHTCMAVAALRSRPPASLERVLGQVAHVARIAARVAPQRSLWEMTRLLTYVAGAMRIVG